MKIKAKIENFKFKNSNAILKILDKKFILSPWIINTFRKVKLKKKYQLPIKVVEINLKKDLNILKPTYLQIIHRKLKKHGYELISPEIAMYTCLFLEIKKPGKWIRFATPLQSLVDDDGIPHLPKLGFGLKKKYIETYWAYKKAVFHPHNNFIVLKK